MVFLKKGKIGIESYNSFHSLNNPNNGTTSLFRSIIKYPNNGMDYLFYSVSLHSIMFFSAPLCSINPNKTLKKERAAICYEYKTDEMQECCFF